MEAVTGSLKASLKLSRRKFKRKVLEILRKILSLTWLYKKVSAEIHHKKKNQQNPRQAHQENLARQLYIWADNYFTNEKYGEALRCYHLSAEMGNDEAIFDIGLMYYEGTGVAQDYGEALKYLRKWRWTPERPSESPQMVSESRQTRTHLSKRSPQTY